MAVGGQPPGVAQPDNGRVTSGRGLWACPFGHTNALRERIEPYGHMPTASLTYDLSDPDDERAHRYALAGLDALIALEQIDQWARGRVKYGELGGEAAAELRHLREHLIPHDLIELME